jgi:hypothetical protein
MSAEKVQLSLDPSVAATMRQRARELAKPVSHYVAELVMRDARDERDALAEAGYRELGAEMLRTAEMFQATDAECLPDY